MIIFAIWGQCSAGRFFLVSDEFLPDFGENGLDGKFIPVSDSLFERLYQDVHSVPEILLAQVTAFSSVKAFDDWFSGRLRGVVEEVVRGSARESIRKDFRLATVFKSFEDNLGSERYREDVAFGFRDYIRTRCAVVTGTMEIKVSGGRYRVVVNLGEFSLVYSETLESAALEYASVPGPLPDGMEAAAACVGCDNFAKALRFVEGMLAEVLDTEDRRARVVAYMLEKLTAGLVTAARGKPISLVRAALRVLQP